MRFVLTIVALLSFSIVSSAQTPPSVDLLWDVPNWPDNPYVVPFLDGQQGHYWYYTDQTNYGIIGSWIGDRTPEFIFRFQDVPMNEFVWLGGSTLETLEVTDGGLSGGIPQGSFVPEPTWLSVLGMGLIFVAKRK